MIPRIEPAPHGSTEYHLYRIEELFQNLNDLWQSRRSGIRIGPRWLQAAAGLAGMKAIPETANALAMTLEAGSRMCNTALHALPGRAGRDRIRGPEVEAKLIGMRNLLIALDDLFQSSGQQGDYPLERETARTALALLVERPAETEDDALVAASFTCGARLATGAIAALQREL